MCIEKTQQVDVKILEYAGSWGVGCMEVLRQDSVGQVASSHTDSLRRQHR